MDAYSQPQENTRIVFAPPPSNPEIPPSIYYVEVANHLDIQWQWTTLPDGNRVVTGYQLITRNELELIKT
ncbi:MAG: hypothetical protein SAJ12_22025 [Jaaginema sp. PMC 1079.18]|nr:hypothetical protein [Jaaginema sp. PMC 1080.18]MEC4853669.1 hypothetical protein [Jaaginema sp. PMC 1079.18]MEC4867380.1 hypothetical protein [Jaaginema sp. PMC 1078.18]